MRKIMHLGNKFRIITFHRYVYGVVTKNVDERRKKLECLFFMQLYIFSVIQGAHPVPIRQYLGNGAFYSKELWKKFQ